MTTFRSIISLYLGAHNEKRCFLTSTSKRDRTGPVKENSYCILLNLSWYTFNHSVIILHGKCNSHGNYREIRYIIYKKEMRKGFKCFTTKDN